MAEEDKGQPSTEDKGKRVGDLRGMIREEMKNIIPELKNLFAGNGSTEEPKPTQEQQSATIKEEVARALKVLSTREERQKRDEEIDLMLKAHKEGAVKPQPSPKEVSKVHRFM